jgi:hypothetical protein
MATAACSPSSAATTSAGALCVGDFHRRSNADREHHTDCHSGR